MLIESLRLGPLEIPEDKIIHLQKPILGFERLTEFCLVEVDDLRPFLWLQAVEESSVAFLVVNPTLFFPRYRIQVNPQELAELCIERVEKVETYVILTVAPDPEQTSVNLQGPILINTDNNRAKQLILVNSDYRVKQRLIDAPINVREPVAV